MIADAINLDFRAAAPETARGAGCGRFASEAEARAWWARHDAENPFEVMLRARFKAHWEMFYRIAQPERAPLPPDPMMSLRQFLRLLRP